MAKEIIENTIEKKDRVITAGIYLKGSSSKSEYFDNEEDFNRSMEELKQLCDACEMEVVYSVTQAMDSVNKGTYMGSGKIDELREFCDSFEADLVVFNDSLTPSQLRNLSDELHVPVMDRSTLILEIFSRRAKTREAKLSVEVASLNYMLPRLIGLRPALSRQGGTSGSMSNRGAGEKKLELDRRRLEARLVELKKELKEVGSQRVTQRKQRNEAGVLRVALVGYTNAGKSTLMNAFLTEFSNETSEENEKLVFEKDMLFATLDTTVRKITPADFSPMLLSDTVGFIDRLPHHLVDAFKSTLEEACEADIILQVLDASDKDRDVHQKVTDETLEQLGAKDIPRIFVYNKSDVLFDTKDLPKIQKNENEIRIYISAKERIGLTEILKEIESLMGDDIVSVEMLIPFSRGDVVSAIKERDVVEEMTYEENGTRIKAKLSKEDYGRYKDFVVEV